MGISFILNANILGDFLGDKNREAPLAAITLVGLGVTLLDFSADSADSPLRALLLDVCNTEDQDTGFNIHSFLGGTGSAFGYVLAAINWNTTFFNFIGWQTIFFISKISIY
jgi:solute carrier family 45 protein 1/2/4